jgi:hypothetical protein
METEVFKTIEGLEDYQISNTGRVVSNKGKEPRFLKSQKDAIGYYHVRLYPEDNRYGSYKKANYNYKRPKLEKVHRLVANAFIPKPDKEGTWEVNHKDGDKSNNDVTNLEWVTRQDNIQHSWDSGLRDNSADKAALKRYRPVMAITPDGTKEYFQSRKHASLNYDTTPTLIGHCIKRGKVVSRGKVKGYTFVSIEELPAGETFKTILNIEQKLLEYKKLNEYYTQYARERRKKLRK